MCVCVCECMCVRVFVRGVAHPRPWSPPPPMRLCIPAAPQVRASFSIEHVEADSAEPLFAVSSTRGVVPAGGEVRLSVRFSPSAAGVFSCETFRLRLPAGAPTDFVCRGRGVGLGVLLRVKEAPGAAPVYARARAHPPPPVCGRPRWTYAYPHAPPLVFCAPPHVCCRPHAGVRMRPTLDFCASSPHASPNARPNSTHACPHGSAVRVGSR